MNILSFSGRANRLAFFLASLVPVLCGTVALIACILVVAAPPLPANTDQAADISSSMGSAISGSHSVSYNSRTLSVMGPAGESVPPILLFSIIFACIPVVWIWIAAQVRRLHDLGASGLFVLINLIPGASFFVWLVLQLAPGQTGSNQYGSPSKSKRTANRFF